MEWKAKSLLNIVKGQNRTIITLLIGGVNVTIL